MRPEDRIAELIGLSSSYTDQMKRTIEVPPAIRDRIIAGFGLDISTPQKAQSTAKLLEKRFNGPLPPFVIVDGDAPARMKPRTALGGLLRLRLETGEERTVRATSTHLDLPPLPIGYHRLMASDGATCHVFAAPPACFVPEALRGDAKAFGLSAQVYSLRRRDDFGIGDLAHVREAAVASARRGASFLGLSPLHALFPADRTKYSPYSPSTRMFIDPIFIDPRGLVRGAAASKLLQSSDFEDRRARVCANRLVDYQAVWALKRELLEALWTDWKAGARDAPAFDTYVSEHGESLKAHATFEALSEHFATKGMLWSGAWPAEFRTSGTDAVRAFARDNPERVRFHAWLQWIADSQLAEAARQARDAGMEVGLYRDLAVGADLYGSELWCAPNSWSPALSVGAPPDPLGPKGQDWGLPPLHPVTLAEDGLLAFRTLVAANMRHAGALRIDHAFQLERLFVIPRGEPASKGAYLAYPFEALRAVLRIESHRAKCLVIAEDLGNGPEGFSDAIMADHQFSYRVLSFERGKHGSFKRPSEYPSQSLSCINTHDLPTFLGWWRGLDIDLRECFGVYTGQEWLREQAAREHEKQQFVEALQQEGLLAPGHRDMQQVRNAALRYLARTKSALTTISFEDVVEQPNQPNLPGLSFGHPNWQRRLDEETATITAPGGALARVAALLAREGRGLRAGDHRLAADPPRATYRLQLHKQFTFDDAAAQAPYLASLGVSHVYTSPITTATPGSVHGYDVIDPTQINPELGGPEGFEHFRKALDASGLKLVVDIVPNHMGIGYLNPWWRSVLALGPASPYAEFFDIDWQRHTHRKLVLPVLGKPLDSVLRDGELTLHLDETNGLLRFAYYDQFFPVSPQDYPALLERLAWREPRSSLRDLADESRAILSAGIEIEDRLSAAILAAMRTNRAFRKHLTSALDDVNEDRGYLSSLVHRQNWRLTYWKTGSADLNYRRFFEIDTLAGLRIENERVFEASHRMIFDLVDRGMIEGLRIDHIDGLANPGQYLDRLQDRVGPGFFIVVEKILEPGEHLPDWPIAGTTGYEALNDLDGIFVDRAQRGAITSLYAQIAPQYADTAGLLERTKLETLERSFGPELDTLSRIAHTWAARNGRFSDLSAAAIRKALAAYIACLPVYRTYVGDGPATPQDKALVSATIKEATAFDPGLDTLASELIATLLAGGGHDLERDFRTRLQQLSGPVMAKGLEDTLFYRYVPLLALDEVGGAPERFGLSTKDFHDANLERLTRFPQSLIATSTHDTKRGEDTRARLLALAQEPSDMRLAFDAWMQAQKDSALSPNDHYLLMQTTIGAWPDAVAALAQKEHARFAERLCEYATKALREAKVISSWTDPNETYEAQAHAAIRACLAPGSAFLTAVAPVLERIALQGEWISLARAALKCTIPGVPDFYQGSEGPDLTLVDPDNRRPVDFTTLAAHLRTSTEAQKPTKQHVIKVVLEDRARHPELYAHGDYRSLETGDNWIAFVRRWNGETRYVIARRRFAREWRSLHLPAVAFSDAPVPPLIGRAAAESLLIGKAWQAGTPRDHAALFGGLPVAVLRARDDGG